MSPARALVPPGVAPGAARERLWLSRCRMPTTVGIAHRLGWLAHELGDEVELATLQDETAASLRAQHLEHELPGLLREGGSVGPLWARARGAQTRLLGLTWVDEYQGIVTAADAPIREPAELAERRLALPRRDEQPVDVERAAARRGFHVATGLAGVFADEVDYVDVEAGVADAAGAEPYAAETDALLRREVDAIFLAGPAGAAAAARIGAREVVNLGTQLDPMVRAGARTPALVTVEAGLLERQPELVVRALATLLRVGAWATLHPDEVAEAVAAETGTTPRQVLAAHGRGLHDQLQIDLSAHKLAALDAQRHFLLTHGFLDADVDVEDWIAPGPLDGARALLASESRRG